jgi:hypothetical protein
MAKIRKAEFTTADYARITGTTVKALKSEKPPIIPIELEDVKVIQTLSKDYTSFTKRLNDALTRYKKTIDIAHEMDPVLVGSFKELDAEHNRILKQVDGYFNKSSCKKPKLMKDCVRQLLNMAKAPKKKPTGKVKSGKASSSKKEE